MLNIIFLVSMYPILFIMWFLMKNARKTGQNSLFGIRWSKDWLPEEDAKALEKEFCKKFNRNLLILALIPFVTFFIPYFSISFTIWMIWLLAVIVMVMLPFAQSNRKLLHLKQERLRAMHPQASAQAADVVYFELTEAGTIRCLKWYDFIAPLVISAVLAIGSLIFFYGKRFELFAFLIVTFALCTLLFYICAVCMDKMKTKVISANSDVNVNYARAGKKIWRKFWIVCAWINTAVTAVFVGIMYLETIAPNSLVNVIVWVSILYGLVTLALAAYACSKRQKLEAVYRDKTDFADDNDEGAWIGGIVYYNPADKHTMVSNKLGTGTSMNLATTAGKVWTIIGCIAMLIIPVSCVWVMLEEFTPISLSVSDNQVTARHLKTDYLIEIQDIESVSLMDELPKSSRNNGTGMDNLQKGNFRNKVDGRVKLFLNPRNTIFLRIETKESIYYMSGYDDAETRTVYEIITR